MIQQDIYLLQQVYQNAIIGSDAVGHLISKSTDSELIKNMTSRMFEYKRIAQKAVQQLAVYHMVPKPLPAMKKAAIISGIGINTLFNVKSSHLAELLMNGNTMGIIAITKQLNQASGCSGQAIALGNELLQLEYSYLESNKIFL